ncbi:uncharacterized protein LOC111490045 [Cucurbita maxima]|uniref:Uncharacterized protein LOC111490045 n=1 Tax=Cucurbita maxima TaxID=3661 RepID=A0A6J1JYL3_CUCMA|nr:uncharacterized protein LOC111490045 [Cucurbita maxima]
MIRPLFSSPMKKQYRRRGTVHPSPPISDHLSFLPAAILTLAAALTSEDREVLAYLISSADKNYSGHRGKSSQQKLTTTPSAKVGSDHPPSFSCGCFRCYTRYWVRWDSSPNREVIHEIIEAYEEKLAETKTGKKNKKERKKRNEGIESEGRLIEEKGRLTESEAAGDGGGGGGGEEAAEKGAVRKIVKFIGETIWGGYFMS